MNHTRWLNAMMRKLFGPVRVRPIRFQGRNYLLIGTKKRGGAIATKEQYENNYCSYAALFEDGTVRRYGEQIGTVNDITFRKRKT